MLGEAGYHKADRTLDSPAPECRPLIVTPYRNSKHRPRTEEEPELNWQLAARRTRVEHPFWGVKRQFGFTKDRYRGLAKNTARLHALFALLNLSMVRRQLQYAAG